MSQPEMAHLELLAEVDALTTELSAWSESAPDWPPAHHCQAMLRRLSDRASSLRTRIDAPLLVATLGGTGSGKSSLVNALVGAVVAQSGKERPTTRRPTLICRRDVSPEMLGIDADAVQVVHRDLPALHDLAIVDCPDPDTTEDTESADTNLARLRDLAPHCDVLLVVTTQQKYNSARVSDELRAAAPGARLVFVQTHADIEDDIREDWRRLLAGDFEPGEIFFVDSLAALRDAQAGMQPHGDFARLVDLLTRELAGAATNRIRRANYLDLAEEALANCDAKIRAGLPAVGRLESGVSEQRTRLSARLSHQIREELLASRGPWENRLLGEVTTRWGFSPFSCVLRLFSGLGGLISGGVLLRIKTPAQMALWGAVEGTRRLRAIGANRVADKAGARAVAFSWDENELRTAAIIVDGYAAEAALPRHDTQLAVIEREADRAGGAFVTQAANELQSIVSRVAAANSGIMVRLGYEFAFCVPLFALFYRFARNFFFDSWLAVELGFSEVPAELLGTDFFLGAAFTLVAWSAVLIWMFTRRLRRGLNAQIDQLAEHWNGPRLAGDIFAGVERECRNVRQFHAGLDRLARRVHELQKRIGGTGLGLGRVSREAAREGASSE